jgi:hypothetical protein
MVAHVTLCRCGLGAYSHSGRHRALADSRSQLRPGGRGAQAANLLRVRNPPTGDGPRSDTLLRLLSESAAVALKELPRLARDLRNQGHEWPEQDDPLTLKRCACDFS